MDRTRIRTGSHRPRRSALAVGAFVWVAIAVAPAFAQSVISASPDITIELGAGVVTTDEDVAVDNQLGLVVLEGLGALPDNVDVVAYGMDLSGGALLAFDTTTDLGGTIVRRGDVARWNGAAYTILFDAAAAGVPAGAVVDAVSLAPEGLLLSFDTTVDLGSGVVAADEDLVRWDGANFSLALDGSAIGLSQALDIDAAHDLGGGAFAFSLDTGGSVLGVDFDDDDVLRYFDGTVSLEYDASAADADWSAADVDAVLVPEPGFVGGLLLGLGVIAGRGRRTR